MALYCYSCAEEIGEYGDADLLSNGLYKHRACFALNIKAIYHRRTVQLFWGHDYSISDRVLPKYLSTIKQFGGKVLYYNSDMIMMIYPSDFPERLSKYCGDLGTDLANNLWGIQGIRQELKNNLPDEYSIKKFPKTIFNTSTKLFVPKRIRKIVNPFKFISVMRDKC